MFHKLFILFLLYMTNQSNISTMIMAFLGLGFGGYLYSRYQDKKAIQQMFESKEDVIRKVFINETPDKIKYVIFNKDEQMFYLRTSFTKKWLNENNYKENTI